MLLRRGLGLSVCLAIVRAHGGAMQAKNLPGGAEVSFRLPLYFCHNLYSLRFFWQK